MDIDAAFKQLTSQANKIINQASASIEDAFNALLETSESPKPKMEDIPQTQPSQAIPFPESVEEVSLKDITFIPSDTSIPPAEESSESFGLSFIADEEDDAMPSDYEECGECGYDHGYEPVEAEMAHAELSEESI